MADEPGAGVAELMRCTLCGQEFMSDKIMEHSGDATHPTVNGAHPAADWEAWRIAQGIPDGMPFNQRVYVNRPPPAPNPPPD
jgi:hypothetical protein